MSESKQLRAMAIGLDNKDGVLELLPYRIDLWRTDRRSVERALARVAEINLAHAIFGAARTEYPDRYVTLRCGGQVIAESNHSDSAHPPT